MAGPERQSRRPRAFATSGTRWRCRPSCSSPAASSPALFTGGPATSAAPARADAGPRLAATPARRREARHQPHQQVARHRPLGRPAQPLRHQQGKGGAAAEPVLIGVGRVPGEESGGGLRGAFQRDGDAVPRERGDHRPLVAEPVQAGARSPAHTSHRARPETALHATGSPSARRARKTGSSPERSRTRFGMPPARFSAPARHREAEIRAAVLLEQQPGIAAVEQMQLDHPVEHRVELVGRREGGAQADRVAGGVARAGRAAQLVLPSREQQGVGADLLAVVGAGRCGATGSAARTDRPRST